MERQIQKSQPSNTERDSDLKKAQAMLGNPLTLFPTPLVVPVARMWAHWGESLKGLSAVWSRIDDAINLGLTPLEIVPILDSMRKFNPMDSERSGLSVGQLIVDRLQNNLNGLIAEKDRAEKKRIEKERERNSPKDECVTKSNLAEMLFGMPEKTS